MQSYGERQQTQTGTCEILIKYQILFYHGSCRSPNQVTQRGCEINRPGDIQYSAGHSPKQADLTMPILSKEWSR